MQNTPGSEEMTLRMKMITSHISTMSRMPLWLLILMMRKKLSMTVMAIPLLQRNQRYKVMFYYNNRKLEKITMMRAMGMWLNKRFDENCNGCARA